MKAKALPLFALGGALAVGGAAILGSAPAAVGAKAPNFSAKGSDGKTHTLASLTKEGPVVLYFIQSTCPVNADAEPYFSRIATSYGPSARVVGVINEDSKGYAAWAKEFKPTYSVLYDPELKIIRAYKAEASPWAILVKNGEIAKVWDGYSTKYLGEINAAVASAAKKAAKKIDLAGTPKEPAFG